MNKKKNDIKAYLFPPYFVSHSWPLEGIIDLLNLGLQPGTRESFNNIY